MAVKKKIRTRTTEKKSLEIIDRMLPIEWEIREIKPDYGIDLNVELFDEESGETLGEHIYIQVKGTENIQIDKISLEKRENIEKSVLYDYKEKEVIENVEVVKFCIDVSLLETVERMSSSVPVVLFVVDINQEKIYFVCLNDYIEKVLNIEDEYTKNRTKTLYIPIENCISEESKVGINKLKFYAKRAKLYSFFLKVQYQRNELQQATPEEIIKLYPYFIDKLLRLDIWGENFIWSLLKIYYDQLIDLKNKEFRLGLEGSNERIWDFQNSNNLYTQEEVVFLMRILGLWDMMCSLPGIYEEDIREWWLPTSFYYATIK